VAEPHQVALCAREGRHHRLRVRATTAPAGVGDMPRAWRFEERHADLPLELGKQARSRRLAHAERLGGAQDGAVLQHLRDELQLARNRRGWG
jgi:hypothetical protein